MRRLLLTFLLMFLPLQSIWAAASPYCSHEIAPDAAHFGHHEHKHHAAAKPLENSSSVDNGQSFQPVLSGAMSTDVDCNVCHGTSNAVFAQTDGHPLWVASAPPMLHTKPALTAPYPHRPERPNWLTLA